LKSSEPTYYEFLGVSRLSGAGAIKSRYRELSLQYHPDRPNAPKNANEVFTLLSTGMRDVHRERRAELTDIDFGARPNRFHSVWCDVMLSCVCMQRTRR
jgi:hypothetical protein